MVAPKNGQVFSRETLAVIAELTAQSWQVPHSNRVDSITNFQHTRALEDDLFVGDLVPDPQALDAQDLKRIQSIALAEPTLVNALVSAKAHVSAININLQFKGRMGSSQHPHHAIVRPIICYWGLAVHTGSMDKAWEGDEGGITHKPYNKKNMYMA